jgi:LacI family transcriptional regulator
LVDIARDTGTSISTVSRVLAGGTASARISEGTRNRVIEAAARMGYRPNLVARSLRTRRSNTIALFVSDIANPWFGQIASLIEQDLHGRGYSLMLCNSGEDAQREREYLELLPAKGIDGLIIVPMASTRQAIFDLLPAELPVVVLDRPVAGINAAVASDQDQAAGILCDELAGVGVKRVAMVKGPQHIFTHRRRAEIVAQRFEVIAEHEGPPQQETGRAGFMRFLGLHPDAIVCTNNFLGQGVIAGIAQIESRLVIGCFDEIPMAHLLPIPIVCSVQDVPSLAGECVRLLMLQLSGEDRAPGPVSLPAQIHSNAAFRVRQYAVTH